MPVFFSANMSYGVHALTKILAAAVPLLDDFDIELTEAHHNKSRCTKWYVRKII